jgi:hypothetical protein
MPRHCRRSTHECHAPPDSFQASAAGRTRGAGRGGRGSARCPACSGRARPAFGPAHFRMTRRMDQTIDQAVAASILPGAIGAVGGRDRVLYARAVGRLSVGGREPARAGHDGLARLDDEGGHQRRSAPSGRAAQPSPRAAGGEQRAGVRGAQGPRGLRLRPSAAAPSRAPSNRFCHLFTHTAGLGYWFTNADVLRYCELAGIDPPRRQAHGPAGPSRGRPRGLAGFRGAPTATSPKRSGPQPARGARLRGSTSRPR